MLLIICRYIIFDMIYSLRKKILPIVKHKMPDLSIAVTIFNCPFEILVSADQMHMMTYYERCSKPFFYG